MDAFLFKVVIFVILFAIGWGFGRRAESKHLVSLRYRKNVLPISA